MIMPKIFVPKDIMHLKKMEHNFMFYFLNENKTTQANFAKRSPMYCILLAVANVTTLPFVKDISL